MAIITASHEDLWHHFVRCGANMFLSGDPNDNWDNDELRELHQVTVHDFEVLEMGAITTHGANHLIFNLTQAQNHLI